MVLEDESSCTKQSGCFSSKKYREDNLLILIIVDKILLTIIKTGEKND